MKRTDAIHCKFLITLIATLIIFSILIKQTSNVRSRMSSLHKLDFTRNSGYPAKHSDENNKLSNDTSNKLEEFALSKLISTDSDAKCGYNSACVLSCSGGTIEEIVVSINSVIEKDNRCNSRNSISLTIQSTRFLNNAVSAGWLQNITVDIGNLELNDINLEELGENSFSGKPFSSSGLSLKLINTDFKALTQSMFTDSSISALEVKFNSVSKDIVIEKDIFGQTAFTVNNITLNSCLTSQQALKNLTGNGQILAGLQTLDLSYNLIFKLESGIFSNAPNIQQLYLISSGITEIELGAFEGLSKIIQLHLSNNNLKTLPEGLFEDMTALISLYTYGNPWKCSCDMQWFKDYLNSLDKIDQRQCKVGSNWIDMNDVDFCPSSTSTGTTKTSTVSSTTSASTASTIQPQIDDDFVFEKIMCRNLLMYSFDTISDDEKIILFESIFKRRNIKYSFSEIRDSSIFVVDISAQIKPADFLIWTNVNNRSDYGCVFNITSNILMVLEYEATYTLCFASNDTTDTYALISDDCSALATPPDWAHRAWIYNSDKITIILCVVFTFFITIMLASVAVYYLVKYNPELIKGNKRVLIVKRGSYSPNVLMKPNKKTRQISVCTDNGGYLTPKLTNWIKRSSLSDMRYQELETITDNNHVNMNLYDEAIDDNNIYESPPPVPPNHPIKRRDSGRPYFYSNM